MPRIETNRKSPVDRRSCESDGQKRPRRNRWTGITAESRASRSTGRTVSERSVSPQK